MCVERLESFTKLLTAENHCANSRKTATWAGGFTFNPGYLFLQIYQEPKNDGECLYNIKEFLKGCTSFRVEVSPPFLQIFEVNGALLPHPCVYFLTPKWRLWMCSVYRTRARWDPGTVNNGSMELLTGGGGGNTAENNHTSAPRKITVAAAAAAAALNSILHLCSSPFHLRSIIFSEILHSTGFSSTIQAFFCLWCRATLLSVIYLSGSVLRYRNIWQCCGCERISIVLSKWRTVCRVFASA